MYGKRTERIEVFGSQRNKKGKICPGQHRDENILGRQSVINLYFTAKSLHTTLRGRGKEGKRGYGR